MSDIKDRLQDMLAGRGVMTGSQWRQKLEELQRQREEGEFEIDRVVPGEVVGTGDNAFFLAREDFPLETLHGATALGDVLGMSSEHAALCASDDELRAFDPAKAVFVDAETTGLAGGTGTVAFLVGAGYFVEGAFRLEQCFMRDFDEEEPMLTYLEALLRDRPSVVSYNGKSFDLPLLRTRFVQNRRRFPLDAALHFDLVHAARRFWKRRLGDCSLGNIEREVLGVVRHGDVASHEIPEMYFKYLRSRDARALKGVFYHHKMDILSLVTLAAWLSRCLSAPEGRGFDHDDDRFSLIRVHFVRKEYDAVVAHGVRLIEGDLTPDLRQECLELLGLAYKRRSMWIEMEETLALLAREYPSNVTARLELAKHYEHRARDLIEAERVCREALDALETREALGRESVDLTRLAQLRQRLDRIRRKLARARGTFEEAD